MMLLILFTMAFVLGPALFLALVRLDPGRGPLALVAHAVRAAYPTPGVRRWSRAVGAMGTTVPWFGFAAAQMMVR